MSAGLQLHMPLVSSVSPADFGLDQGNRPLRHAKQGRHGAWVGHVASRKALGPAPHESLLERDEFILLSVDPMIKCFAVQAHHLIYWMPGADGEPLKHQYTPDIVAQDQDDRIFVIEVKAKIFANGNKWKAREPHIRQAYADDHGIDFYVVTEDEIRQEPRLSNCKVIYSHRAPPNDEQAEMVLRDVVGEASAEALVGQICATAMERRIDERRSFSALMRLAMTGAVSLDLSRPLGPTTRVIPAGRG